MANLLSKLNGATIADDAKVVGFDSKFVLAVGDSIKLDATPFVYEDKTSLKKANGDAVTIAYFAQEVNGVMKAVSLGALGRAITKNAIGVPDDVTEVERAVHPLLKGLSTVGQFKAALKGKTIKVSRIIEFQVPTSKDDATPRDAKKYCYTIS
jgi:hypothetical protein